MNADKNKLKTNENVSLLLLLFTKNILSLWSWSRMQSLHVAPDWLPRVDRPVPTGRGRYIQVKGQVTKQPQSPGGVFQHLAASRRL